jgi:serine protease Do
MDQARVTYITNRWPRAERSAGYPTGVPGKTAPLPSSPPRIPGRLAFLGIGMLVIAFGCARLQPTAASLPPTKSSRQGIIDRIIGSSVKVLIEQDVKRQMFASGIVIASRPPSGTSEGVSYVLTAAHSFTGTEGAKIFVGFCGSEATRGKFAATVIGQGTAETTDLALLRVPGLTVPPVDFPEDDVAYLGDRIVAVGFPEGERLGISAGIVSQVPLTGIQNGIPADRTDPRIVIDASAPRGVSGGGVFEVETGRLIGIVQGHQTYSITMKDQAQSYALKIPVPGATFVVPISQIRPFLTSPSVAKELSGALALTAHAGGAIQK